jgi:chaperonin cofactor prefoldin
MRERIERIDELNDRIAQLRDQNRRLDEEAERLAQMVRLTPGDPPKSSSRALGGQ